MSNTQKIIEDNLLLVLRELREQPAVAIHFSSSMQSYEEQLTQIEEYLVDAAEYGLGYELIVALLETMPFKLSGLASIKLLEVGLLMGFKTELPEDAVFDRRT